eukprot:TRINITY_DN4238_c0_g1_i1.p1 TRINITY_DN4238_c0_g1~~TRINITY_DN4238_c0_g1_i1.p1  ORF type:complete len:586 (-),score=147.40 TRINITY_DN4238_c0_g1_i1:126-1883(-)
MLTESIGTQLYMAPEVERAERYDFSADMWSLGVLLYIMLSGTPPFNSAKEFETLSFDDDEWKDISSDSRSIIRKLIHPDPKKRLTASELLKSSWSKVIDESDAASATTDTATVKKAHSKDKPRQKLKKARNEYHKQNKENIEEGEMVGSNDDVPSSPKLKKALSQGDPKNKSKRIKKEKQVNSSATPTPPTSSDKTDATVPALTSNSSPSQIRKKYVSHSNESSPTTKTKIASNSSKDSIATIKGEANTSISSSSPKNKRKESKNNEQLSKVEDVVKKSKSGRTKISVHSNHNNYQQPEPVLQNTPTKSEIPPPVSPMSSSHSSTVTSPLNSDRDIPSLSDNEVEKAHADEILTSMFRSLSEVPSLSTENKPMSHAEKLHRKFLRRATVEASTDLDKLNSKKNSKKNKSDGKSKKKTVQVDSNASTKTTDISPTRKAPRRAGTVSHATSSPTSSPPSSPKNVSPSRATPPVVQVTDIADNSNLEDAISMFQLEISKLQSTIQDLQSQVDNLTNQQVIHVDEISTLRSENQSITQKNEELEQTIKQMKKQIGAMTEIGSSLKRERDEARQERDKAMSLLNQQSTKN